MKSFRKLVLVIFSLVATILLCGPAMAAPFTWTDSYDPADILITCLKPYSFVHNLNPDFVPGQDLITDYSLTLGLYDDKDKWLEIAFVNLPGIMSDGFYNFKYDNNEFGWSLAGFFSLNTLGTYQVTISSWLGDFYFDYSTLKASGYNNTAPVPEPASMILFGTGLVVFGFAGRKFKTK